MLKYLHYYLLWLALLHPKNDHLLVLEDFTLPVPREVRQEPLTLLFDFFLFEPCVFFFAFLDEDFISLMIFSR